MKLDLLFLWSSLSFLLSTFFVFSIYSFSSFSIHLYIIFLLLFINKYLLSLFCIICVSFFYNIIIVVVVFVFNWLFFYFLRWLVYILWFSLQLDFFSLNGSQDHAWCLGHIGFNYWDAIPAQFRETAFQSCHNLVPSEIWKILQLKEYGRLNNPANVMAWNI
jgi:hypothetical protein